jgi:hypothetical protein
MWRRSLSSPEQVPDDAADIGGREAIVASPTNSSTRWIPGVSVGDAPPHAKTPSSQGPRIPEAGSGPAQELLSRATSGIAAWQRMQ